MKLIVKELELSNRSVENSAIVTYSINAPTETHNIYDDKDDTFIC